MCNFSYHPETKEGVKPFRRYSREYFIVGLKLLGKDGLDQETQLKIVTGTLLGAMFHNDNYDEHDVYYQCNPLHLSLKLKDQISQLLEPHTRKKPCSLFWKNEELDNYLSNKINVLGNAILNKELILDESIFIKISISDKDQFNQKLKEMFEIFDIGMKIQPTPVSILK